jgi:hypothetical protein
VAGVTTRMSTAEASLIVNATNIALKVNSNGVIASINASVEGISISANKLNLSGYVTLTNLSTSGQTTINGGNIIANSIKVASIDTTSLTAAKIYCPTDVNSYATVGAGGNFSINSTTYGSYLTMFAGSVYAKIVTNSNRELWLYGKGGSIFIGDDIYITNKCE